MGMGGLILLPMTRIVLESYMNMSSYGKTDSVSTQVRPTGSLSNSMGDYGLGVRLIFGNLKAPIYRQWRYYPRYLNFF